MSNTAASQYTNNDNVQVILRAPLTTDRALMCRFARNVKGIKLSTN